MSEAPNIEATEGLRIVSNEDDPSAPVERGQVHEVAHDESSLPRIAILGDVELRVDVVLGRARRTLQDLLGVRPGQTIELDRQRNSPVEVLVNNKPFALGEIVVIDETNLGVRILEILDWASGNATRAS